MNKLFSIAIASILSMEMMNAQTVNSEYYGFEAGKMATSSSQKNSCGWFLSANDVYSISESQNHTEGGSRSLKFSCSEDLEKQKIVLTNYSPKAMINLGKGSYRVKLWVFVESGTLEAFDVAFPACKFKAGKRLGLESTETPDFESPYRVAALKPGKKLAKGKWVQLQSAPLHKKDVVEVDTISSAIQITYKKGASPVTFYIDDIEVEKVD